MKCDAAQWCRGVYLTRESTTRAGGNPEHREEARMLEKKVRCLGTGQRGQNRPGSRGSKKDLGLYPESTEEPLKYFKQGHSIFRFSL